MDWESLGPLEQASVVLVHLMVVGQLLFVALWASFPWWKEWVGRALMIKSFSLLVLLVGSLALFWGFMITDAEWSWAEEFRLGMNAFVTLGIWTQLVAFLVEWRTARRENRPVGGTDGSTAPGGVRV